MAFRVMGLALLAALPLMSMVAAEPPQCKNLYSRQWTGGATRAMQGGVEYTWVFYPCTPGPANQDCNQPPYSGNVYLAQLDLSNPNPCLHELFCEASPESIQKTGNGDVVYQFPQCVPSQSGNGPSPRSATVTVTCDSPTYRMDTVIATKTNPGYHFAVHVHAPCGPMAPVPGQPNAAPVAPPAPPLPTPCLGLFAETATDFFTLPLNTSGSQHGQVFDWGFNLCHQVEYNGNTGYFLNMNAKTRDITNLNLLDMAVETTNGYKFSFSSSYNQKTAVVEVLTGGGRCAWLSEPEQGVVGTINSKGDVQYNLIVQCMSS